MTNHMKHVIAYRLIAFDYTDGLDELVREGEPMTDDELRAVAENDFADDVHEVDMTPTVIVSDAPVHVFDITDVRLQLKQIQLVRIRVDESSVVSFRK
jgi:hypothetical protein